MRNTDFLDNKQLEDDLIGGLQTDESNRAYRMINGEKIYQIEEKSQHDSDMNLIINRVRASGMKPFEYLNHILGRD